MNKNLERNNQNKAQKLGVKFEEKEQVNQYKVKVEKLVNIVEVDFKEEDEMIERLIPLYDKHFTSQDLKTYIDFYSSEKGQRLMVSIGAVTKESIEVATAYLKEKFPEVMQ